MSTIRLTKTPELARILAEIKAFYPLLDDAEVIKMIISKFYSAKHHIPELPTTYLTPEEEEDLAEALDDMEKGNYVVLPADEPVDLDKLLDQIDED